MVVIENYINRLINELKKKFGYRLLYVGLQGSYLREEADERSDIDVMVLLDKLTTDDLELYKTIIAENENSEKSCGFICGKSELNNWNPSEMCQLINTTKDYYGKLSEYIPAYTTEDNRNFIKLSLNNLYHEICHRYIHASKEKNKEKLPVSYKSVFFILQNIHYQETGNFLQTQKELLLQLSEDDKKVLSMALNIRNKNTDDFDESFQMLFDWCKNTIIKGT